ncbi:MAG: acyl-CoA synthetase [Patescibacteria group bacterium]|nr:MAG: acyl-CoA synthetase [Patescibacteria group bacterium]
MNLSALLSPQNIAVVGASKNPDKLGYQILANLQKSNFKGQIFPINNKDHGLIQGLQSFTDLTSIPSSLDCAVIAVPATAVESIVDQAVVARIKSLIIISAGFKETDAAGKALESRITEKCRGAGIILLGPNCLGLINNYANLNASFAHHAPQSGNIAFISQSGAFGTAAIDWADSHNLGFSLFVSLGNKAGISENDFLDQNILKHTKVLALYLEDFADGSAFITKAQQLATKIPIIVLKPGKTIQAQQAISSHTGSLASSDHIVSAALEKAGVIRAHSSEELFHLMHAFSYLKPLRGNRISIITNAGGPGILATDHLVSNNLQLAQISPKGASILQKALPRQANIHDPIDVLGDAKADRYLDALKVCIHEPEVDAILAILTPQTSTEIQKTAEVLTQMDHISDKPILSAFLGGSLVKEGLLELSKHKLPAFYYPEDALFVLGKAWEHYQQTNARLVQHQLPKLPPIHPEYPQIINQMRMTKRQTMLPEEAALLFQDTVASQPHSLYVKNHAELEKFHHHLESPLVLKIISTNLLHKSDIGGVLTNLDHPKSLNAGFIKLQQLIDTHALHPAAILAQEQAPRGLECFLGMKRDHTFNTAIVFGSGGIYTEIYQDTHTAIAPLSRNDAIQLVSRTKIQQILQGARGQTFAYDKLIVFITQFAQIILQHPELSECDINPLIVTKEDLWIVDSRIIVF